MILRRKQELTSDGFSVAKALRIPYVGLVHSEADET